MEFQANLIQTSLALAYLHGHMMQCRALLAALRCKRQGGLAPAALPAAAAIGHAPAGPGAAPQRCMPLLWRPELGRQAASAAAGGEPGRKAALRPE